MDEQPVTTEPSPRRVRVVFGGQVVADSTRALLLLEAGHRPVYYFPRDGVRTDLLVPTDHSSHCPHKGDASYWSVRGGEREAENAAWSYEDPLPGREDIRGHVAFYWNKVDSWFEEDEEVFVHPRDPHHRVDVLHSSRHVRVVVGGVTLAETGRPRLLFETGLPPRHYIPNLDVRMDLLSPTSTRCPYKGTAVYWSVEAGGSRIDDVAWSYPTSVPECPKIADLVCFFHERVDELWVDGELVPPPETPWSVRRAR